MKRGAERQITKDGPDDDDDGDGDVEEIHDPQGFQKADESALARRQIRALPKRALAASRPPSLNGLPQAPAPDVDNVEAPQSKFGGFAGFGAATSASNPFTFGAQPQPASAALDTTFKTTQSTSPFSGVLKPSHPDFDVSPPKAATSPPVEETDAVAFKYFKSLRGLNVSFLSAISTAVEKDPFFDVAGLVESYKNLRTTIQTEFDGSSQPATTRGSATTNSTSLFGAKAPPEKTTLLFSAPKLSVESIEAAPKLPPINESGTKIGGFTFPPFLPPSNSTTTQSPFGLISRSSEPSPPAPPELPKSTFTFPASNSSSTSSLLPTSGSPSTVENATSNLAPGFSSTSSSIGASSQPTSTTPSFGANNTSNLFSNTKLSNAFGPPDTAFKPTSVFGSSIFGGSGAVESSKPSLFNPTLSDGKDSSKVPTTLFGTSTTTSASSSTSIFGSSSDKPVSFFGSASPPKSGAFAFGKPGGSIGNPVGFGFGGSASSAGDTTALGSSGSGSNFVASSTKPTERLFSPPVTDKSSESTPQPEAEGNEEGGEEETAKLLPSHTHDEEGEGEEDEETTHAVRCKVYRLSKTEDKNEWKDHGVGMFRLKKHKETHVRRVLMRNSNTGRILMNFRIYGSLKLSLAKTSISFIGYENNSPISFRVRVKTEDQATDLKQAMEREIAAIQEAA